MKEFKSIGFNLDAMTPLLIPLFVFLYVPDMLDVFFNNYIYIIGGVLFYALFCITVVKVNREGIRKELYLAPITLKTRTWREIKHYAHVTENWTGSNGKTKYEMLWFIDHNDKVCLRIQKSTRKNLDKILEIIDKFEDKYEIKLDVKNPYFMAYGYSKVKYPAEKSEEVKKDEKPN